MESDFFTLMRAFQFAKNNHFSVEQCRRYGVHAQIARQMEQTFEQILQIHRPRLEGESTRRPRRSEEALPAPDGRSY